MLKNLLACVLAVVGMVCPALPVSAEITPGELVYVIGDFEDTGWGDNKTPAMLTQTSPGVYTGFVYFNNDEHWFRFCTDFENWEETSIGSMESYDSPSDNVEVDFLSGTFQGKFYEGPNCWHIYNFTSQGSQPRLVKCTLDFNTGDVRFEGFNKLDGQFYFVSENIEGATTAPNDFDYSNIAYDGNLDFHFEYIGSDGVSYSFGPIVVWMSGQLYCLENPMMSGEVAGQTLRFGPTFGTYTINGCTSDDPVSVEIQPSYREIKVKRSSFDPANEPFGWWENPFTFRAPVSQELKSMMYIGEGLEVTRFEIRECDINGVRIEGDALVADENATPGTFYIRAYSNIEGKYAETGIRLLAKYPEAFAFRNEETRVVEEGILISKVEDQPGLYKGKITIPAGEGDYRFTLTDPENTGGNSFCGEFEFNGTNAFSDLWEGDWSPFIVPEALRGETFTCSIDVNTHRIMLYQDDVPFFWKGGQIIMTGYTEEDLRNFIVASEGVEITGFSIAEGEVEGARIFDSFYLEVDETAPSSVINIIAHANVEGLTAQKEVIIRGEYPVALRLKVADESESGNDLVINQVENERGVYQGDVTIPAGAGDFRFKFVDTEYPDREYGVSISLEGTSGRGEIHDWSDDYMTIPASLRGETFTFRINLPRERIEVYQGENPFVTTVTPVEGNPEYAVANRNTPGFMFKVTPADASFDLETDVDGIYASRYSGGDGLYNVHIDIENWVMNSGSRTFNLIFKDGEEIARFPIEARYISVESVSAPEEIVIHEGEFVQYNAIVIPEIYSDGVTISFWPGLP